MEKEISSVSGALASANARVVRLEDMRAAIVRDTGEITDLSGVQIEADEYYMMTLRILVPKAGQP